MKKLIFLCAFVWLLCVANAALSKEWEVAGDADIEEQVSFRIALKQRNVQEFENLVMEISNPKSPKYTQYMSIDEVMDMIAPAAVVSEAVLNWVVSQCGNSEISELINQRDSIKVTASVYCIQNLLNIQMLNYRHIPSGHVVPRIAQYSPDPSYPKEFKDHIKFVTGLFLLPQLKREPKVLLGDNWKPLSKKVDAIDQQVTFNYIIPETARRIYNIPTGTAATNPGTTQTVIEFLPVGSPALSDLQQFAQQAGEVFNNVTTIVGPWDFGNNGESTLDIEYITTIGAGANTWYITIGDGWMYDYANLVFNLPNPPLVHSISYGWPEQLQCGSITNANCTGMNNQQYVSASNTEFAKLASRGLSVVVCSQDEGAPSEANIDCSLDQSHPLWPIYPPASPWVTAVSATTLEDTTGLSNSNNINALPPICTPQYPCDTTGTLERPCMVNNTYYTWTTGGGFSMYAARPSYQDTAVSKFLSSSAIIPPNKWFNPTNRGYPDISALGSRILIIQGGQISVTAGTSASTPIIAGIVSLLNDWRLNNGKKPLGFLNPMLYQMAAAVPTAFNDVVAGNNMCTIGTCCTYGYGAAWGWDPVTGLGTPNFVKMLAYVKTLP